MIRKKIFAAITAFSAAASMFCTAAFAASDYNADDLVRLSEVLLGMQAVSENDDINSDGSVDSLDLCTMRKALLPTGEFSENNYSITSENVKLTGRTYNDSETTWLVQSGAAAEFTVTGKSASVTLAGDSSISNDADYRPRYAVFVDGEQLIDEVISEEEKVISLFDGETSRTAEVKVIHLSEANNGPIGVKNINVVSDALQPVKPAEQKELLIEFIGDSITCAYGVEGANAYEPFKTTTENFMKSYAYLTAQKLDADYSAVSYSGHGIISGYSNDGTKNTDSLVPALYDYVGKWGYEHEWDFTARQNDVVVINLGTNDNGYVTADLENNSQEFIDGYIDFLEMVRDRNPEAYIICTMGTMGCPDIVTLVSQAAEEYKTASGDDRVMFYESVTQNQADGLGSDWHPSAVTQQNSAYVLADKICQALGMESDQIGLDVAVDAEYVTNLNAELGGNASSFVGYDKSFWINMVTGGTAPEAVEAVLSGIGLKSGGEYRLEFEHTVSVDKTIPVIVRGSDGEVIFSEEVDSTSSKVKETFEFTVSENDPAAELVFLLGGQDYYNVTLSNIKLVKIG